MIGDDDVAWVARVPQSKQGLSGLPIAGLMVAQRLCLCLSAVHSYHYVIKLCSNAHGLRCGRGKNLHNANPTNHVVECGLSAVQ